MLNASFGLSTRSTRVLFDKSFWFFFRPPYKPAAASAVLRLRNGAACAAAGVSMSAYVRAPASYESMTASRHRVEWSWCVNICALRVCAKFTRSRKPGLSGGAAVKRERRVRVLESGAAP